jgi:hypothetical protein
MNPLKTIRTIAVPVALAAAFAGCGSGADKDDADAIRKQGAEIQQQGAKLQEDAAKLAADVKAGRITQAEADRRLKEQTAALTGKAADAASDAIDVAKDAGISDEAKAALEDAEEQLQKTP